MGRGKSQETDERLAHALHIVEELPYRVSARYLFYDLLQNGFYSGKGDYDKWIEICRVARKQFYKGWTPDTLIDGTRPIYYHGWHNVAINISHFIEQDYYVEMWFEAEAMSRQFEYYNHGCTLRPFKGDYSIPKKWDCSKDLEEANDLFGLPIVILYFGDCDKKGKQIPESAVKDIRKWSEVDFDFIKCGLTIEQAKRYELPVNPDKPNEYQWEALRDEQAGEIITTHLLKYINPEVVEKKEKESKKAREEIIKKYFN